MVHGGCCLYFFSGVDVVNKQSKAALWIIIGICIVWPVLSAILSVFGFFLVPIVASICISVWYKNSLRLPSAFPYYVYRYDISGRHTINKDDILDEILLLVDFRALERHRDVVELWKQDCISYMNSVPVGPRQLRIEELYGKTLDENNAFIFKLYRTKKVFEESRYGRKSRDVQEEVETLTSSFDELYQRYMMLQDIGFETTWRKYHSKQQRSAMTKELRKFIMERDNYTCQWCGKYMPDEVGLQIDHIIPVSKGGTSDPDNLQVLCSKCNGAKSNKM